MSFLGYVEEVVIARDHDIGVGSAGRRENPSVVGVTYRNIQSLGGLRNDLLLSKQRFDLLHRFNGETYAAAEDTAQFREHDFADEQFMFGEDMTEHVSGEAAGGEGADEDVRVKKYPHDTTRATSSSVR